MTWTIPNLLTIGRILAAPCLALVFVLFDRPSADWVAFGLFVGAAITDFFDGWLARRLGQITEIGKMLDPIADKAMVIIALAVLLALFAAGPMPSSLPPHPYPSVVLVVPVVLIMLREVLVSGLREYLGDVKLSVTKLAKWKTTVQMVAIAILLLFWPLWLGELHHAGARDAPDHSHFSRFSGIVMIVGIVTLWIAAILTVLSGWDYFRKGLAYIRAKEEG